MTQRKGQQGGYPPSRRAERARAPLGAAALEALALAYVARFSCSAHRLAQYCRRKLRERGWDEAEAEPDVDALVQRFVAAGYVDDAQYARARAGSLLRRGYGPQRVSTALHAAGIGDDHRAAISEAAGRAAALKMARKRGFGPFGRDGAPPTDRAAREKQIAVMLRAGHSLDSARELVDARDAPSACAWADEASDEEDGWQS